MKLGFTDVSQYPGGLADWFTLGYMRQTVTADGVDFLLANIAPAPAVVDTRTAGEFAVSRIPGAQNEPLAALMVDPAATLAALQGQAIILYGAAAPSAGLINNVATTLEAAGFRGVYLYMGGFADWTGAGKPVEQP